MMKKKVVLAFSGGLDTSFCCIYLTKDRDMEVHSVIVNTGGFSENELREIEKRAYALGVTSHSVVDETKNYYKSCIRYLIFGNVLKNATYPLSVSAERVSQATAIANYVKKIGADYVAHGSTGAGNDQVRFDMIFNIMIPGVEIITPIQTLPEDAWPTQVSETRERDIELTFQKGELVGLDGETLTPVKAIQKLQEIAQPYGIGRDIHVGDTIIGIKGRVGFEAAAPIIIIKAHHTLEKHTLTKWQLSWKDQLSQFYGNWLHEGQFHDPVMRNMEAFMADTQETVSGKVFVKLYPYRFQILGIESEHDLMSNKFGSYGEMNNSWSGEDVKGFSKIFGNQTMIYHRVNEKK